MNKKTYDIIIIGGGIMGCATAYYLIRGDSSLNIAVAEKDPSYEHASTTLSMANVRIQFSLLQNILISKYTLEVLENFDQTMTVDGIVPGIDHRKEGNLFLVDKAQKEAALRTMELQNNLGCNVQWWPLDRIKEEFPLYDPPALPDLAGATFGPQDGHLDANSFLMGYRRKARSMGVTFLTGEVSSITAANGKVTGIDFEGNTPLNSGIVINCAGAWAADIAKTTGVTLPIQPVKRQVYVLDTTVKPNRPLPLTNLPSGLYFRSETGGVILLGKSTEQDPVGYDFSVDEQRFTHHLWPELAEFAPPFHRLKLLRGWAGLYAVNTFDGNAILGEWPDLNGFYLANGFSGHGLQQAPAVGRYLSQLILKQKPTLDLSTFSPQRLFDNTPLKENGLV